MMAKKIHQPAMHVTNEQAPPACTSISAPCPESLHGARITHHDHFLRCCRSVKVGWVLIVQCQVVVCCTEEAEGEYQAEEDDEEDDIRPKGANEVDQTKQPCAWS